MNHLINPMSEGMAKGYYARSIYIDAADHEVMKKLGKSDKKGGYVLYAAYTDNGTMLPKRD